MRLSARKQQASRYCMDCVFPANVRSAHKPRQNLVMLVLFALLPPLGAQYKDDGRAGNQAELGEGVAVAGVDGLPQADGPWINIGHGEAARPRAKVALHVAVGVDRAGDTGVAAACHGNAVFDAAEDGVGEVLLGLCGGIEPGIVALVNEPACAVAHGLDGERGDGVLKTDERGERGFSFERKQRAFLSMANINLDGRKLAHELRERDIFPKGDKVLLVVFCNLDAVGAVED